MQLTFSEAIELVMRDNGNFAPLKYIYDNFEKYREKTGKTPDNTIQERVQRAPRFTRIGKGVYALTDFLEHLEKSDIGFFKVNEKEEIVFQKNKENATKVFEITEKIAQQKIRKGQSFLEKNF